MIFMKLPMLPVIVDLHMGSKNVGEIQVKFKTCSI